MDPTEIKSNFRYVFDAVNYSVTVGVPIVNGETYKPITKGIEVLKTVTTRILVTLERPPMIRTQFFESGNECC